MPLTLTGYYAAPLALFMIALGAHVTMLRASAGISIMDGGNPALAERIRRHGNFIEYVPMALLLMALAEAAGTAHIWLHAAGVLLIAGRCLHAIGLRHDKPATAPRIVGSLATNLAMLVATGAIVIRAFAG